MVPIDIKHDCFRPDRHKADLALAVPAVIDDISITSFADFVVRARVAGCGGWRPGDQFRTCGVAGLLLLPQTAGRRMGRILPFDDLAATVGTLLSPDAWLLRSRLGCPIIAWRECRSRRTLWRPRWGCGRRLDGQGWILLLPGWRLRGCRWRTWDFSTRLPKVLQQVCHLYAHRAGWTGRTCIR